MAACSISHPHRDLYNDMRVQFPELPDTVIRSYVQLYPRNREQCIQQLTLASQNQLYSQYDSEENPPSRGCGGDGFGGGSCAARVFEPLDPPFAVDEDLPPPYPGTLSPVRQVPSPRPPVQTRLSPREETGPHGAPGSSRAPPTITAPWLREYRSPTNFNPSVGPWFPPVELDPPGNRLPPALDDMTQALLTHQRQRYELLQRTYAQQLEVLQQLRREVEAKETQLITKTLLDVTPTHVDELQRLRRENRTLDVECHCLLSEVDLYSRGEVPLGATDEHFYRRLNPGQTVPVAPSSTASTVTPAPPAASLHSLLSEDEENQDDNRWKCSKCTFLNHPALDKCEVCEMPNVARDV